MLAPERAMLDEWLEYQRATLADEVRRAHRRELRRRSVPPSSMSLLGLVRHMADVERHWFREPPRRRRQRPPTSGATSTRTATSTWSTTRRWRPSFATFAEECAHSRIVAAGLDLDATGSTHGDPRGARVSLRWVLVHMIEEYARHNGHADLLRECIDGTVGD